MTIRGLTPILLAVLTLAGCAAGSGRQGTEIVVTGVGPTAQVQGGGNAVFTMTVKNTGPYNASNIKVVDNVGNQLRLISITCTATGGASCPSSPSVDMEISSLPNGGALIFAVTVQVDGGATGIIQNTMSASFAEEIDPTQATAAVTASAISTVTNVVVSGTGPAGTLVGGSTAVFVMTVTNNGPDAATNFNVYDNVGNGLSLVSITCAAKDGAVCPSTVGVLTAIPSLPSGGVLTFTVTTQVGQNVNGTVTNQLVANIGTNPTQSNDSFFATATVVTADIAVTGTAPAGPLMVGSAASFTMVVTNNGPGTAENIAITNALSTNVTASGAITCVAANGATCPTTLGPSMTLASMPATGTLTFTVPFTVNVGASGPVTDTMTVTSSTDARGPQTVTVGVGSGSNFITVTETGSPTAGEGTNAVFTAVVANTGPGTATNITVTYTLAGPAGAPVTVNCTAAAGIICPAVLGPSMVIPSLGVGRAMNFTITVPVPAGSAGSGAIISTVTANAIGNNDTTQNTASFSTSPVNSNDGTYTVFAANGLQYTMVADFEAGNYVITGNGANITVDFTPDSNNDGGFTGSGGSQFRVNTDVIVGGQNFGQGVIPYIAARVFATTIQQLAGTSGGAYDLMTVDLVPKSGGPVTSASTGRVSGNVLAFCKANPVTTPQNCGSSSLQSYSLSVDGNVYTALPTVAGVGAEFKFQEAQIGATSALLSATTAADGSPELIIGLPDSATVAGGSTQGQSSRGTADSEWISASLSASSPTPYLYTFSGALGAESAPLSRISNTAGPFSMLVGPLSSPNADNNGQIYVMQSYPITVAIGGPAGTSAGAAEGLIQITTP
jgi:uncharacterized repeat protein (TIGR01451 family)